MMKRLAYIIGVLLIALCLFASAYGERSQHANALPVLTPEQQEAELVGAKIDELAARMDHLKTDMAALKLELIKSGKGERLR